MMTFDFVVNNTSFHVVSSCGTNTGLLVFMPQGSCRERRRRNAIFGQVGLRTDSTSIAGCEIIRRAMISIFMVGVFVSSQLKCI
jgi:hypothetical protein